MVPCPSMTCACLNHGPSQLPVYWSCPLAHSLGLPCLPGLPLWVWLGLFGSLPPWFPFCGVGWFFAGLFAPLVWSGRLGLPTPWSRLFPLGLCPRCSWRAFVVGCCGCCCGCPLALRCLFGGSSDQSSHIASLAEACSVIQPSKQPSETMNLVVSGLTVAFLSCVVEKLVDFDGVDLLLRRWSSIRCFKPRRISKSWFPTSFSE